jgi:hypothetical protein
VISITSSAKGSIRIVLLRQEVDKEIVIPDPYHQIDLALVGVVAVYIPGSHARPFSRISHGQIIKTITDNELKSLFTDLFSYHLPLLRGAGYP